MVLSLAYVVFTVENREFSFFSVSGVHSAIFISVHSAVMVSIISNSSGLNESNSSMKHTDSSKKSFILAIAAASVISVRLSRNPRSVIMLSYAEYIMDMSEAFSFSFSSMPFIREARLSAVTEARLRSATISRASFINDLLSACLPKNINDLFFRISLSARYISAALVLSSAYSPERLPKVSNIRRASRVKLRTFMLFDTELPSF